MKNRVNKFQIILCLLLNFILCISVLYANQKNIQKQVFALNENSLVAYTSGEERSNTKHFLEGSDASPTPELLAGFTDIKYIPNANYFLINPKHHSNFKGESMFGLCTVVGMQLLLGYHNYYSDRRLIPASKDNKVFLDANYGNILMHPNFYRARTTGQGCSSIGTTDAVFDEILGETGTSLEPFNQIPVIVKDAVLDFIEKNAPAEVSNSVSMMIGDFSASEVRAEIDLGRPVVLVMDQILDFNLHVVPAYGYAKLDGVDGFLVHYGWGEKGTKVWVPASFFGRQVMMNVAHTHTLVDTGNDSGNVHREVYCSVCGYRAPEKIYNVTNNSTISSINYPLESSTIIPSEISVYSVESATFTNNVITAIGDSAFANQTQITSVTLPNTITSIGNNALAGCSNLTYVNIPSGVTSIGENAFGGCSNLNLSVSSGNTNYCVEDGVLYNKEKTVLLQACNIPENYVIPSSVTQIAPYAFSGNTKLTSLQIDGNITSIGNNAFENCVNLQSVRFTSSNPPIFGNNLFLNDNTIIYVPYSAQNAYKLALPTYANNITSKEFFINLISNGTIVETKVVYDGEYISELPELTLIGYSFGGWYDNTDFEGTSYNDGDLIQADTMFNLYAKWNPNQYTITLDANGGTLSGSNQITVYYGLPYTTESIVEKTGYKFLGWYDNSGETGGSCYITSEGNSTTTWNMTNNLTLYARWGVEFYEIQIIGNGTITWLGTSGLQSEQCSIPYGTVLNAINLIYEFKNSDAGYIEGHIFDHFNLGNEVINLNTIEDLGDDGDIITITPVWIKETHTIHFNLQSTGSIESITMEFGEPISLPIPIRDCYTFIGWKESLDDTGYVNWTTMQDLTLSEQNNGSVMLYADWEINTYTIVFHSNNGTEAEFSYSCVCNQQIEIPTQPFNRLGYNIKGWARSESGEVEFIDGEEVENVTTVDNDIVHLYAIWQANVYNIIYKNLTSDMLVFDVTYTYGIGLVEMPKVYLLGNSSNEMTTFYGWYTDINFTNKVTSISTTSIGDITVYGKYDYRISDFFIEGPYTIESKYEDEPIFKLHVNIKSFNTAKFESTTIKNVKIKLTFDYCEKEDGYQQFYLYNGDVQLQNKEVDLSNGIDSVTSQEVVFDLLSMETYKDVDVLTLKFGATGFWGNDWVLSNIRIEVLFTN